MSSPNSKRRKNRALEKRFLIYPLGQWPKNRYYLIKFELDLITGAIKLWTRRFLMVHLILLHHISPY